MSASDSNVQRLSLVELSSQPDRPHSPQAINKSGQSCGVCGCPHGSTPRKAWYVVPQTHVLPRKFGWQGDNTFQIGQVDHMLHAGGHTAEQRHLFVLRSGRGKQNASQLNASQQASTVTSAM